MIGGEAEDAVIKSIVVGRSASDLFKIWADKIGEWWPAGHSVSHDPDTRVLLEPWIGGRFYEQTSTGAEHEWGQVTAWDPPAFLAFSWYLGSGQARPSHVEVRFVPLGENQTQIVIEHRGPKLIGDLWVLRQKIFNSSWTTILKAVALLAES